VGCNRNLSPINPRGTERVANLTWLAAGPATKSPSALGRPGGQLPCGRWLDGHGAAPPRPRLLAPGAWTVVAGVGAGREVIPATSAERSRDRSPLSLRGDALGGGAAKPIAGLAPPLSCAHGAPANHGHPTVGGIRDSSRISLTS